MTTQIYTIDHSDFIECSFMENSIGLQSVNLYLTFRSIPFATVTPSLVIFGLPQLCSKITFLPCNSIKILSNYVF